MNMRTPLLARATQRAALATAAVTLACGKLMKDRASLGHKGKQGDNPGPLDGQSQGALMFRAGTGNAPGKYLPPLGDKTPEGIRILVVYLQLLGTEFTYLFLVEKDLSLAAPAAPVVAVPAVYLGIRTPVRPGGSFACITVFFI
jgi:hypothetical protein